jgi:hypothetical protein
MLWRINPNFLGVCSSIRQIVYVLLTRAPLVSGIATLLPFDLHVLGLPLAFILSQDQTLHCKRVRSLFECTPPFAAKAMAGKKRKEK